MAFWCDRWKKGSRAEKAGFRAGDVVVKVNDQPVHDTSDFAHSVKSRNGSSVKVVVMRDRKEQTLTLSLPSRNESGDLIEEESFDAEPLMQAQSRLELSVLRDELAQLQPQMALTAEASRKAAEEIQQEFCKQQKEFQKQSARQKQLLQKDMEKLQKQLLKMKTDWL